MPGRLRSLALIALAEASAALAGDDLERTCDVLAQWHAETGRELPWVAGTVLAALGASGLVGSSEPAGRVLGRFLVGAEDDAVRVRAAKDDAASTPEPDLGHVIHDAFDRCLVHLRDAYAQAHAALLFAGPDTAADTLDDSRSDVAAAASVLRDVVREIAGREEPLPPPPSRVLPPPARRPRRDGTGLAVAFVAVALATARVTLWTVLYGVPPLLRGLLVLLDI